MKIPVKNTPQNSQSDRHKRNTIKLTTNNEVTPNITGVVYKGEDTTIDNLDELIEFAKTNRHIKIKDISGDIEVKFKTLVDYVTNTYDIPSQYESIRQKITDKFADVKGEAIQPSTIQAYCIGCIADTSIIPRSCSAVCAGSAPSVNEDDGVLCKYVVYIASMTDDNKYIFTAMNHSENNKDVLIYVTGCDNASDFQGFSDTEKMALMQKGVEMVNIIGYDIDKGENSEISTGFIPMYDVKTRMVLDKSAEDGSTSGNNEWQYIGIAVFVLIVVILLIFIGIGFYRDYKSNHEDREKENIELM